MSAHNTSYEQSQGLEGHDPGPGGFIHVTKYGQLFELVSAGAETRTLVNPTRGGMLATIRVKTFVGNITLTAANGLNVTGNTTAVFDAAGEQLFLISVSATTGYRWEIVTNTGGVGLS